MQFYEALEQYGYELQVRPGAVPVVEAHRTPAATISAKAAAPLLLELSRHQDEAIAFLRSRAPLNAIQTAGSPVGIAIEIRRNPTPEAFKAQIEAGNLSDVDEAITYCKYNLALGYTKTSDDRLWIDVLQELLNQ
jgi:hypothetical protein